MKHTLKTVIDLPLPLETVFEFFTSAHNLEKITPPEMGFQVINPAGLEMREGLLIDYRLRILGVPLRWQSLISKWNPPHEFVDEQKKGPYALWHHHHGFEKIDGGTRIRDTVEYALPFAPLGDLGHFFVRRQLAHIFAYREESIRRLLLTEAA